MTYDKTLTASQLVQQLNKLIDKHGDLPVYAKDADTDWRMPVNLVFAEPEPNRNCMERFEIVTEYSEFGFD